MAREKCPKCKRLKARNATDAVNGDCDKWYAINDEEAKKECAEISETTPEVKEAYSEWDDVDSYGASS